MKATARKNLRPLLIKHSVDGRNVGSMRVRGGMVTIGSSLENRIRLHSKDIAGVCCVIENGEKGWTLIDLGSQPDVRLDGKSFLEEPITETTVLEIGDHRIELVPVEVRRSLFNEDIDESHTRKLTVVKLRGRVYSTLHDSAEIAEFKKYESDSVKLEEIYVPLADKAEMEKYSLDPELKKPLFATVLAIFLFFAILLGLPIPKKDLKPADNVYTKMIFDSKVLQMRKKELVSYAQKNPKGTGAGNGAVSEGTKGQQSKAMKAVASLRQAGVSNIINKIALRAASSAKLIAALAATPEANAAIDHQNGMMPLAPSANAASGAAGILGNGKGFKVGGIGTGGKGGGTGGYKAGTGLGTGSVGNGQVGLEDTESVVEGGLDKEVIAAVIREHLGQIRYCYERQLAASPDLYGKLKIRFTIDANGEVDSQEISQTTMKSNMVEDCILRRIATWKFPKPKGGTKVIVSYPFLFKSVN